MSILDYVIFLNYFELFFRIHIVHFEVEIDKKLFLYFYNCVLTYRFFGVPRSYFPSRLINVEFTFLYHIFL